MKRYFWCSCLLVCLHSVFKKYFFKIVFYVLYFPYLSFRNLCHLCFEEDTMKRKSCPQVSFPDKLFPVISFNILAATSQTDYCLNLQLKVLQISTWALYMPLWPCTLNMCFTFQWNRSMEETICSSLSKATILAEYNVWVYLCIFIPNKFACAF